MFSAAYRTLFGSAFRYVSLHYCFEFDAFFAGLGGGEAFFSGGFAVELADGDAAGEGEAIVAGAADGEGDGCGDGTGTCSVCKIECEPVITGSESVKAINMNAIAAPMVIFDNTFCVPRGPNAVLDTLLVKRAPASALPGCSSTTTMSTRHERMNNPYRI
jgi:hypothetical protein